MGRLPGAMDFRARNRFRPLTAVAFAAAAGALALAGPTSAVAEGKAKGNGAYVPLTQLLGTIMRSDGSRGVLSVDLGLDVPDADLRKRVEQSSPRLRAAYLQTVQAYTGALGGGSVPNPDYLIATFQRQTDAMLGRPGARVLIGSVIVN